jgi:hypothetical protein
MGEPWTDYGIKFGSLLTTEIFTLQIEKEKRMNLSTNDLSFLSDR